MDEVHEANDLKWAMLFCM